jgi:hypothetical protein
MSLLPNQTFINTASEFYVNDVANVQFISSIGIPNGTLNTSQIDLDSVRMDCAVINGFPTLLLNGQAVAGVSSLTSSVTSWASYPALQTITYAGAGGTANLATVNALTALSSQAVIGGTVTSVGALNGVTFPNPGTAIAGMAQSITPINGTGLIGAFNFTGQAAGLYLVTVLIQTGGADPLTCSAVIRFSGGVALGGSFHCPSISSNSAPGFANCVSIQSDVASDAFIQVYVFSNINAVQIGTAQLAAYRIT